METFAGTSAAIDLGVNVAVIAGALGVVFRKWCYCRVRDAAKRVKKRKWPRKQPDAKRLERLEFVD